MEAAKLFFSNLIKVYPLDGTNKYPKNWSPSCIGVTVPTKDKLKGVQNSDLHLYVIYINEPNNGMLANAGFCALHETLNRPNFGRVNFNIGRMKNLSFEDSE